MHVVYCCRTIYTQMSAMFVQQGNLMQRNMTWIDGSTVLIPSASMSIFNTVSIILLVGGVQGSNGETQLLKS